MEQLSPTEKARCGSELKETRREFAKVKKECDGLRRQLEAVTCERDGTMTELQKANDKLDARRTELDVATRERDRTREELQISKDPIDVRRAELDALTRERKRKRGHEENEEHRHSSGLFQWFGFVRRNRGTGGEERGREGASQT